MKYLAALLVLLAGLLSSNDAAAAGAHCEGCTFQGARQKALSLGLGKHAIASVTTGDLWGFEVYTYSEPGFTTRMIRGWEVDATKTAMFEELEEVFVLSQGSYATTITISVDDIDGAGNYTVYDIVHDPHARNTIGDALAEGRTDLDWPLVGQKLLAGMSSGVFAYFGTNATITFVVQAEGGGTAEFKLTPLDTQAMYAEGRSETSAGDPIPENEGDIGDGTFDEETQGGYALLIDHLVDLGVNMTKTGYGDYVESITCTSSTSGGKLTVTCTVRWINPANP